jgi:hypothetical protein
VRITRHHPGPAVWSGNARNLIPIHVLLGLVVVLSLWVIGIGQAFSRGGSWAIAAAALVVGAIVPVVGVTSRRCWSARFTG